MNSCWQDFLRNQQQVDPKSGEGEQEKNIPGEGGEPEVAHGVGHRAGVLNPQQSHRKRGTGQDQKPRWEGYGERQAGEAGCRQED